MNTSNSIVTSVMILLYMSGVTLASIPESLIIVTDDNYVTAYKQDAYTVAWERSLPIMNGNVITLACTSGNIVFIFNNSGTVALDAVTGNDLWASGYQLHTMSYDSGMQLYTSEIRYPYGAPNIGGTSAPDVLLISPTTSPRITQLVDARNGAIIWEREEQSDTIGYDFIPTAEGSYDIMFSSATDSIRRVDGYSGQTTIWSRGLSRRWGKGVPDVSGDGTYDWFAEPSYYSDQIHLLDGGDGHSICYQGYGAFDVLGALVLTGADGGYDAIVAAQGASSGGVRRYSLNDCPLPIMWNCATTYSNNTLIGFMQRPDGMTVLSGWRHQERAIAIDANTGSVLWDNVPASDVDYVGLVLPDLTGDDAEDLYTWTSDAFHLYDGISGIEVADYPVIEGYRAAFIQVNCPTTEEGDLDGDGDVDLADLAVLLANYGRNCILN